MHPFFMFKNYRFIHQINKNYIRLSSTVAKQQKL